MKTTDLGHGWFANQNDDGSMTIRNCELGLRSDLPPESVEILRAICEGSSRLNPRTGREYADIDPRDIDPETGAPYAGYSSPALDTSFHDAEMDVD